MSIQAQLLALNEELRRLKAGGQRTVVVDEASLERLRAAVAGARRAPGGEAGEEPPAMPAAPAAVPSPVGAEPRKVMPAGVSSLPSAPPEVVLPPGDKATRWAAL